MRSAKRFLTLLATVMVATTIGLVPALADSPQETDVAVIEGQSYGRLQGAKVDTYQLEITPGSDPVGMVWEGARKGGRNIFPEATWGSSYAISTETVQLYYSGKAKAAGNVYSNKRIIQVCIWYTRDGVMKSDKVCSNAVSTGNGWASGPEVRTGAWDSLNPWAPPTIFNISTVRISPNN